MRYPASSLRIMTADKNNHKDTSINFQDMGIDTYIDYIYDRMYDKANVDHEDHISIPCGLQDYHIVEVMQTLRRDGYSVDMSRSGAQGICMLNIGWGPDYVIGGNAPLLN